jgi:prepilin-type N-terminal cleavage/methylation domain-containing protein
MRILHKRQFGFTLMEIVVATAIFAIVISSVLALFNYVLRINSRVQAARHVAQGARVFTEILSREIRNGRISYAQTGSCNPVVSYTSDNNRQLALTTYNGDKLCFYLNTSDEKLYMERITSSGTITDTINPSRFTINASTFRFVVKPTTDPLSNNQGVQPLVTIMAEFVVNKNGRDQVVVPYQTTISSDIYDIPSL